MRVEGTHAAAAGTTLRSLFDGTLEGFDERTAVVADDRAWSYRETATQADTLARALARLGVGPGVPVVLAMSNSIEYVVADLALIRCGAAKVPLNDALAPREVEFVLRDSGAAVAIADGGMLPAIRDCATDDLHTVIAIRAGDHSPGTCSWHEVLADPSNSAQPLPAAPAPDDIGLILYTGGTTGRQKGVVHTQRGLATNLIAHLIETAMGDDERLLLTSPLPHSAGFLAQTALLKGATVFLDRRFDPDQVLNRIERDGITFTFMVPTMIYRLLDRAAQRPVDVSSLRTLLYGAAPITFDRLEQGLRLFGRVFVQLYGQSEAPNFLTRLRRADHDPARPERLGSCGQPALFVEIEIRDGDDNPVPAGTPGEIVARAPYLMSGYHNLPGKSAESLRGGWLHTGDIGKRDRDGYVYLLDRMNDIIISGGMNVYSSEVENVLAEHPAISQAAVVGVPHPDWGEAVVAFVTVEQYAGLDPEVLDRHCRDLLAAYKRPKAIREVRSLPTTAYGKVDKKQLRESWPGWGPEAPQ